MLTYAIPWAPESIRARVGNVREPCRIVQSIDIHVSHVGWILWASSRLIEILSACGLGRRLTVETGLSGIVERVETIGWTSGETSGGTSGGTICVIVGLEVHSGSWCCECSYEKRELVHYR